ncbi:MULTISPECIES: nucleotide sugar dehydrogenase [Fusobacterium]|jgi:nucleotide sugar dehydrogenase|uniref:Nucleotide sugar dehydrogenase n=1 Tax=Fusobacterium vincentii TaxID=155615 RepID=A0AAJ1CTZ4_FUSVC|nr:MULTISPECIES: nucleotide sugar dehydrogenase [Fusobacterium]ERT44734.1 UDP-N-acetyl-D-mannosaminuronic acid dehydrogenase [Fusobacterium nucleatum CTI-7]MCW0264097.1 nucleotide sugar dehydrogenase [Fusobacterium vincentii]MDH2315038.1 nucleotide sugar dehydrogenase [Fusobacterium nucleatum]STO30466.1 UDP-glucose 6-dehydrogenase tuaD [Fusobacterium vincentii]
MENLLEKVKDRNLKITILGMGYIGLPTAIAFARAGFVVNGFDVNLEVINSLKKGHIHIVEPDLQEAFLEVFNEKKLIPINELKKSDVFIIAVPTPFKKDHQEKIADLSYVESAAKMVSKVLEKGNLVILESTVPPMTTKMMTDILEKETGISRENFMTAHCPERVLPGRILFELENNDRIIGVEKKEAGEYTKEIYKTMVKKGTCYVTDDITAEMCKLVENTFRDINIAFANELSVICDKLNIDVFKLIELANKHPRVNILTPGSGVGGHCLAVDPWFIVEKFPKEANVIREARLINDYKPRFIANKVDNILKGNKNLKIGILGLAYKPDIDDLRESPAIEIAEILRDKGYNVIACEPNVHKKEVNKFELYTFSEIIDKSDYLVLTQGHKEFKENINKLKEKNIYDCLGLLK